MIVTRLVPDRRNAGEARNQFHQASVDLLADDAGEEFIAGRCGGVAQIGSLHERRRLSRLVGFQPRYPSLYRLYNIVAALALLLLALPLLLAISIALLATQGSSIFYRGARLTKDGRSFLIYKFRTLDASAAARLTKDRTLPRNTGAETRLGGYLRDTRLDELPQLLNVLKGDMNLCGPRPVRPEIAAIESERVPGYSSRFMVKPGLVGPAQALMSHGTSKRIRARFNNLACRRQVCLTAEIRLLAAIAIAVLRRSLSRLFSKALNALRSLVRKIGERLRRVAERLAGTKWYARVEISPPDSELLYCARFLDESTMAIPDLAFDAGQGAKAATLIVHLRNDCRRRARILLSPTGENGIYTFAPCSAASAYIIDRYVLSLAVVGPSRTRPRTSDGSLAASTPRFGFRRAFTL